MARCGFTEEELRRISAERESTNYLFKAYLVSLILGFISIPFLVAATLSATSEPSIAIATFLIGAGVVNLVIAAIVVPIMYKGIPLTGGS